MELADLRPIAASEESKLYNMLRASSGKAKPRGAAEKHTLDEVRLRELRPDRFRPMADVRA
ncbi:hypothetical protein ASE17_19280 [Phenylobacterium sp. Root77]|nr:hypothetical protein ASC73_20240 [Phenylobacterium sp. Root1277]KQW94200.1 hypothetical protein ASC79_00100 [Phenylobacterium sp. Root1290]KRC38998.1 hypothetical protein ASE17_19280 [Phenylobacterium sp. Root77]